MGRLPFRAPASAGVLLVGLVFSGACGAWHLPNPFAETGRSSVHVEVQNRSWADVIVFVRAGSTMRRLGMVPAQNLRAFVIPRSLSTPGTEVHLRADPVGSDVAQESPPVVLGGGETLVWTLVEYAGHSTLVVR